MINRISINGKRYIASRSYGEMLKFCQNNFIPTNWIRQFKRAGAKLHLYYYLRLWGSYNRTVGKDKVDRMKMGLFFEPPEEKEIK